MHSVPDHSSASRSRTGTAARRLLLGPAVVAAAETTATDMARSLVVTELLLHLVLLPGHSLLLLRLLLVVTTVMAMAMALTPTPPTDNRPWARLQVLLRRLECPPCSLATLFLPELLAALHRRPRVTLLLRRLRVTNLLHLLPRARKQFVN